MERSLNNRASKENWDKHPQKKREDSKLIEQFFGRATYLHFHEQIKLLIHANASKINKSHKGLLSLYSSNHYTTLKSDLVKFKPLKDLFERHKNEYNGKKLSNAQSDEIKLVITDYLVEFKEQYEKIIDLSYNKLLDFLIENGIIKENDRGKYEHLSIKLEQPLEQVEPSEKSVVLHHMILLRRFIDEALLASEKFNEDDQLLLTEFKAMTEDQQEIRYNELNNKFLSL